MASRAKASLAKGLPCGSPIWESRGGAVASCCSVMRLPSETTASTLKVFKRSKLSQPSHLGVPVRLDRHKHRSKKTLLAKVDGVQAARVPAHAGGQADRLDLGQTFDSRLRLS